MRPPDQSSCADAGHEASIREAAAWMIWRHVISAAGRRSGGMGFRRRLCFEPWTADACFLRSILRRCCACRLVWALPNHLDHLVRAVSAELSPQGHAYLSSVSHNVPCALTNPLSRLNVSIIHVPFLQMAQLLVCFVSSAFLSSLHPLLLIHHL